MIENGPGTFNLVPDTVPYDDRRWLHITLRYRDSVYIGNPMEGQHLRLESLGHSKGVSDFKIFEKIGKQEKYIGYTQMIEGHQYRLADTNVAFSSRKNNPDRIATNLYISMPPLIEAMRGEVYEKAKTERRIEEVDEETDMAVRFREIVKGLEQISGEFKKIANNLRTIKRA